MRLVDGHCHTLVSRSTGFGPFDMACTEADTAPPAGMSHVDGPAGTAIRRWCPPVLDLVPGAPIDEYFERREQLGAREVTRRLLGAAQLSHLLVDTGLLVSDALTPAELGDLSGAEVREVVRLESVAEGLARQGIGAAHFASAYSEALAHATRDAFAVKSILAYRGGFALGLERPSASGVREAAARWLAGDPPARLSDPVLLRFVLWCGIERGLPVQIHTGLGDRDLALGDANPALLQPFLNACEPTGVPVVLLHCYPYQRQAAWLAQVYRNVYVDVGLSLAQTGAQADVVLAEFFELAPFGKLLFSTDGAVVPELFFVGAAQFRHSLGNLLGRWVADGAMRHEDATHVALQVGSSNARRLYSL